jgi:hypothetical protein
LIRLKDDESMVAAVPDFQIPAKPVIRSTFLLTGEQRSRSIESAAAGSPEPAAANVFSGPIEWS